ncbi:MAG: hypothetical protein QM504_06675 [Pseudomonadota bacterium]
MQYNFDEGLVHLKYTLRALVELYENSFSYDFCIDLVKKLGNGGENSNSQSTIPLYYTDSLIVGIFKRDGKVYRFNMAI